MKKCISLFVAAVAMFAGADEAVGRIRHMSDTYLQSDCSQIIDTGFLATTNMRIEVVFEPIVTNGTRYLFGSAANNANSSPMKYGFYVQQGESKFAAGTGAGVNWGDGWYNANTKPTRSHFTVVYDCPKRTAELWSGDTRVWNKTDMVTPGFETNTCTVTLFGNHQAVTTFGDFFGGKVYSFRLFDKGTLIRDMIPYGRGAVTGMLDRCSGKVYTNMKSDGRPFVLGTGDGYVRSNRAKWGGQFLDTGYCVNPQTKIEVDFAMMDVTTGSQYVWGAHTVAGICSGFYVNGSKQFAWAFQDDQGNWQNTGLAADGARHTFTLDAPNATVALTDTTGATNYSAQMSTAFTKTAGTSLRIFGSSFTNQTGVVGVNCPASVRIYGMKIWNGATLVRDYVPRVVDNVEGLYDTVNGTFAIADPAAVDNSDNGKFRLTGGGDIVCTASAGSLAANMDSYLESFGSQGIDTGFALSRKLRLEIDFAMNFVGGTQYLFGNASTYGLFCQRQTNVRKFALVHANASNGTGWPTINDSKALPVRYRAVMDLKDAKWRFTYPSGTASSNTLSLPSTITATENLWFFCRQSGQMTNMRLYSFAVYEDNVLVHRYTPCVESGVAGVWDSVDKQFLANSKTADGKGFEFHGAGVDGGGMVFTEQPQGGRLSRGHTLTLTAFAPGAAGYQWLKNGEIVEGATGRTLEATYGEGGTTDTYQCISYYALFGYGASEAAQVENLRSGTTVMLR